MLKVTYANGDWSLIDQTDPQYIYRTTHALHGTDYPSGYLNAARILRNIEQALKDGASLSYTTDAAAV